MNEFGMFRIQLILYYKSPEGSSRQRTVVFFEDFLDKTSAEEIKKKFISNNTGMLDDFSMLRMQYIFKPEETNL